MFLCLSDIKVTLGHKASHKWHGCISSNSQQFIVWVKTISRILNNDHVP